jgi:hypothetical protein
LGGLRKVPENEPAALDMALEAAALDKARVLHRPRLLSDKGSSYISGDLAKWLNRHDMGHVRGSIPVCTENSVRVDYVSESPNVSGDDRSLLPLPGPVRLAVQVEERT